MKLLGTENEPQHDLVYYTTNPNDRHPRITDWDNWKDIQPELDDHGTYLLAPVAKIVDVETPGETKPVEPYVGLVYQNDTNGYVGEVRAIFDLHGKTYVVIYSTSQGLEVQARDDMVNFWHKWPTTTTPPRKEKRLVMLNGWTRDGFPAVSESGGTTDER